MRQRGDGPFRIINRLLKAADLHWHFGIDNFRNLFIYSPNGKKDGIQIIPLSEVAAKDEFLNNKNVSRDDMMAAHCVPLQMIGIMPSNVGGLGMWRRRLTYL
jgi:capsid portal protein